MSSLILDTCGLIYLVNKGGDLSKETLKKIEEAEIVFISAASALEIGCKYALGKLDLPLPAKDWYKAALDHHDIIEVSVNGEIAILSSELPMVHKDPADRLIIATAKMKKLPVVTHDRRFSEYGIEVLK